MSGPPLPDVPAGPPELAADPGSVREAGRDLLAASSQLDALGGFVAGPAQVPDWYGVGALAYRTAIRPLGREADELSLALRAVARRVDLHADRLHDLLARRDDLEHWRTRLVLLRDELVQRADPVGRLAWTVETAAFAAEVRGWCGDVDDEEQAMLQTFARHASPSGIERRYSDRPDPADDVLASMPPPGSDPQVVHAWWRALTAAQRFAVTAAAPGLVGNLDGLRAAVRDRANQDSLRRDLADLGVRRDAGVLTEEEGRELGNAQAAAEAQAQVEQRTDPVTGLPLRPHLLTYDPGAFDGDGAVALTVGDLDRADHVALLVPGLGTTAASVPGLAGKAVNLYDTARSDDPAQSDATVAWIGYDAPSGDPLGDGSDAAGVLGEGPAADGGNRLAGTLLGLDAARPGDPAEVTLVGHSYGSTTVGHALSDHPDAAATVDDVAVVGSPGLGGGVHHAGDLHVDPAHVWVGANSRDPVTWLGDDGPVGLHTLDGLGLGYDPAAGSFGAHRFAAETLPHPGDTLFSPHQEYLDPHTESLANLGHLVAGQPEQVVSAPGRHLDLFPGLGVRDADPEAGRPPTVPDTGPW